MTLYSGQLNSIDSMQLNRSIQLLFYSHENTPLILQVQDILEQLGNSGQLEPLLQADECQYGVTKSEEDSSWGRVKIKKIEGGSTEVLFLDFGSVEIKRPDEIL